MDLTIDKAIAYHRQLWDWLSENPKKEKKDWPGWKDFYEKYPEYKKWDTAKVQCFVCYMSKDLECEECVLRWPGIGCCYLSEESKDESIDDGLFASWEVAKGKTRSALARQIRDLPVRYPAETWNPLEAWRNA